MGSRVYSGQEAMRGHDRKDGEKVEALPSGFRVPQPGRKLLIGC